MHAALSAPRSACFGGGPCHLGAVFQQTVQGQVTVRLRFDELARFSPSLTPYLDRLRTLVRQRVIAIDLRATSRRDRRRPRLTQRDARPWRSATCAV
jgi:hypothetical protein